MIGRLRRLILAMLRRSDPIREVPHPSDQVLDVETHADEVRYDAVAAPLLAELAAAGFPVATIGDLRRGSRSYEAAVPILARWLLRVSYSGVRHDIIHALGVPWARSAAPVLIEAFCRADFVAERWSIASALVHAAGDDVFDDVVRLARDRRYGRDREMLAVALGKMRDPRALDALLELVEDEDLAGHAAIGLGELGAPSAAGPALRRLRRHPKAWVRREARRALRRKGRGR